MVTLQAAVELKPREAEELGGARLVPMRTLERLNDRLALELIQRHGRPSAAPVRADPVDCSVPTVREWRGGRR